MSLDFELVLRFCSVSVGVFLLVFGIMQNRKFRKIALDDTRREVNEEEEQELAEKLNAIGPKARESLYKVAYKIDKDEALANQVMDSILTGQVSATRDLIQVKLIEKHPGKKPDSLKVKAYRSFVNLIQTISRLLASTREAEN
ncbi:MAG TPA: hypothetical protein VJ965_10930 [Anaerolineales bacterium]|nr:hypothetical protein [Anaerolineales bacterium]